MTTEEKAKNTLTEKRTGQQKQWQIPFSVRLNTAQLIGSSKDLDASNGSQTQEIVIAATKGQPLKGV